MNPPETTAYEWLDRFMLAQAGVAANALFLAFQLGQLGAAARFDPEAARAMLADLRTDRTDLTGAAAELGAVVDDLIANIERNLA